MAREAKRLGRSYLVVTDHSHYLREGRIEAQSREIDKLQAKLGRFKLLKGVEANIRANGEVDVADDVLAKRDWVMASVHSGFDKDLTERVLAAMENPHVDCIGHLTGRKLNRRGPADVDIERVVEKALETGTFLEINAQPDRLDLRDAHARLAGEAGVKIVISSDAHEIAALVEPRVRRRPGAAGLARAGADPEHAALGLGQEAAQEVRYRAVIFDLWQTLVPWDVEESERFHRELAETVGVEPDRFWEAWLSAQHLPDRNTGPMADHFRALFGELGVEPDLEQVLTMRRERTKRTLVPRPEALPTLEELRRRGHLLGMISVCTEEVPQVWDETPLGRRVRRGGLLVRGGRLEARPPDLRDRVRAAGRRAGRLPLRRRRRQRRAAREPSGPG